MLTTALDASRTWGTALNRMGWGAVVLFSVSIAFQIKERADELIAQSSTPNFAMLTIAVAFLLAANLIGAGVVSLGYSPEFDYLANRQEDRIDLLLRVLRVDNPQITNIYNDFVVKRDAVAGAYGAGTIIFICFFIDAVITHALNSGSESQEATSNTGLAAAMQLALYLTLTALVRYGADSAERFLTETLRRYELAKGIADLCRPTPTVSEAD